MFAGRCSNLVTVSRNTSAFKLGSDLSVTSYQLWEARSLLIPIWAFSVMIRLVTEVHFCLYLAAEDRIINLWSLRPIGGPGEQVFLGDWQCFNRYTIYVS